MAAVASVLIVLTISILVTKLATLALVHTGLSRESARFQARSAFTGVGFTTTEAEQVVSHPVRRRILMILMILGNVGIVSVISSLVLSFVGGHETAMRLAILAGGGVGLFVLASSQAVDRAVSRAMGWALRRWTDIDTRDYANLLHLAGDYRVQELLVEEGDWLAGRRLEDLRLPDEGVLVLGVTRPKGRFLGAPTSDTEVQPGDVLIVYGRDAALRELDERRAGWAGDAEHREAIAEHQGVVEAQARAEAEAARVEAERARAAEADAAARAASESKEAGASERTDRDGSKGGAEGRGESGDRSRDGDRPG